MASTSGIKAGSAYVELLLNDSKLAKGLQKAARRLQAFGTAVSGWGQTLAGVGAAVLAPLALASAKVFADMGSDLYDMSQRTGVSVEALSELAFAAEQSGSDLATLEAAVRKMQRGIVAAAKGSQTAQEALGLLGLSVQDLAKLSPEQQFKLIADRLSQIKDPTLKAALAMELFGRSGTALLPLLANGAKGIEQLQQQARDLGLTMSSEDAAAAEALGDTLDMLWKVLQRCVVTIGSALAPVLSEAAAWITDIAVTAGEWLKQNRQLVVSVFKVAAAVVAGGLALLGLGTIVSTLAAGLGTLATVLGGVGTAVGILGAILSWILSPIGLVIVAVAALAGYLVYASGVGAKTLSWLAGKFTQLKEFALESYQGIADALAAGDIALAARILWLSLKLAWQNGTAALQKLWLTFSGWFIRIGYGAFYGLLAASEIVWHGLKVVWIEGVAFLQKLWATFTSWHARAVEGMANAMVKAWIWAQEKTGAIDEKEADDQRQYLSQLNDQQQRQIGRDKDAALAQAEQEREAARQAETERHQQRLAEVGKGYNDAEAELDKEHAEKVRQGQAALDAARQEWQDAIAEAKKKRQAKEAGGDTGPGGLKAAPNIDEIAGRLSGLGDLLAQKRTIGAAGSFNAMDAFGLGAGTAADRIAAATEATAKNTKKLLEQAQDAAAEFE